MKTIRGSFWVEVEDDVEPIKILRVVSGSLYSLEKSRNAHVSVEKSHLLLKAREKE